MKKIGIISDTHSCWDKNIVKYFKSCDEIWHAGDIGNLEITDKLAEIAKIRCVYGNIDDHKIRQEFPKELVINYKNLKIYMTHIGGKPYNYNNYCKKKLKEIKPDIFICGHSHICKIMYDKNLELLYINPGSSGYFGFHKIRTIVRLEMHSKSFKNIEVIELGLRSKST